MTVRLDIDFPVPGDALARWTGEGAIARMWARDATVWFDPPRPETGNRLGWLDLPVTSRELVATTDRLAAEAVAEGITDLVLCGMGGSSLAPEVFAATLPTAPGHPRLTVIDTTHPDAVAAVHRSTDPRSTWYLISSKSGGTLETMSLFRSFWATTSEHVDEPGSHFLAVTDPGSSLARLGDELRFRDVVLADPDVGGRYSALSAFGLVPAGIIGADIGRLLAAGRSMAISCGADTEDPVNPGLLLGVALGHAAAQGRVIAHFDATAPVHALPVWVEQLIAESTGKEGRGIVPVDGGPVPSTTDRAVMISIGERPDDSADIRIAVDDPYDIAGVMFLLEFATAVAGAELGINPFDQPDVQLAKTLAHRAMDGDLPDGGPAPVDISDGAIPEPGGSADPLYVSIQAYVAPTPDTASALGELRAAMTERYGTFVTVGYGPRFLHSTGQLHKGGPAGGLYVQLTDRPHTELEVPGEPYTFNQLVAAQAAGDRAALADRDRDVIAYDLGNDPAATIERLTNALRS